MERLVWKRGNAHEFFEKRDHAAGVCRACGGPDVGSAADVEAVMKKYDRESNTRYWEGIPKLAIQILMAAFAAYSIIDTVFLSVLPQRRLPFSWA